MESQTVKLHGGCWIWCNAIQSKGYGVVTVSKYDIRLAHRHMYEIVFGEIPAGKLICHTCDTPACINPQHLFLGSPADNQADMVAKGRSTKGRPGKPQFSTRKLSDQQADQIRVNSEGESTRQLARRYRISQTAVRNILSGKTYKLRS